MRRARPYRGENSGPGKDDRGGLDTGDPELENKADREIAAHFRGFLVHVFWHCELFLVMFGCAVNE
jgi:hypothetical protein